ncbi:MAG: hypothetical protein OHK0056_21120 [Bacteriovoracaceae bacterium]
MSVAKKVDSNKVQDDKKFITDDLEIIDLFRYFAKTKEKLWAWQNKKDEKGFRPVHFAIIKKFDPLKKFIEFVPNNSNGFRLREKEEIYIFSKTRNLAFKAIAREMGKEFLIIGTPKHINILSEELAAKLSIVEKEDEESNLTKRTVPRKSAKDGQMVSVERIDQEGVRSKLMMYGLYDISQGGMGFRVSDPAEFLKGDIVEVVEIDGKPLPKRIVGIVVAVREMEDEFETFKVGVQFKKG